MIRCSMADQEKYSEAETVRRREAALKRILRTPHQPHMAANRKPSRLLKKVFGRGREATSIRRKARGRTNGSRRKAGRFDNCHSVYGA